MSKTIYVIDDNDYFREMAVELLVKSGYETREFMDGQDALQKLEKDSLPDLIVTDVNMPQINGMVLAKTLRANAKFEKIPLIICSNDDLLCDGSQEFNNVFYIDKEFSQLLSTVEQLVGHN